MNREEIIDWLLSSDPSIRWQVKKYLLNETDEAIHDERLRIDSEGWGKKILSFQDEDGKWSGQLYNGKWTSTTYTLLLLANFGIIPNSKTEKACHQLFINGVYNDEEIRFSSKQKLRDNGVTGLVLGILSYFEFDDIRIHGIADYLVRSQNADGSWFFDDKEGAEIYSFETTMIVLKGLFEYKKRYPERSRNLIEAEKKGQAFLLNHHLFLNIETNLPINKKWLKISFPYYWFYDILVALDYFRELNLNEDRLKTAIEIIRNKQKKDYKWNLENKHSGKTFFEMEQVGKPSRWNTLRCLRVIEWWNKSP
ncbi:MAG: hypothetical protein JW866_09340 [Ignavibacteriales bacterium]|nr:hypothetical protein [Ignavibacteriales bacterium]